MTSSKQTAALALTGAVALASGAYALGSQAGGGDAVAAKAPQTAAPPPGRPGHWRGDGPADLDSLATRLGVDAAKLRAALEDIRGQRPDPARLRDDFAQELADALGIDVAKVTAAFGKVKPAVERRHDDHRDIAAALAKKLGLSTSKVQAALEAAHDRSPDALAKALGVTPQKLRQAFDGLRPGRDERREHHGPAPAALAKALGVTQAKLTAAFDKLKAAHEKEFAQRRDELAKALADRLGLDASKVKQALEAARMVPGRPGP
jgi:DNA-binding transcriptional regulator YdaS (Cro superfamily)